MHVHIHVNVSIVGRRGKKKKKKRDNQISKNKSGFILLISQIPDSINTMLFRVQKL